MRYFSADYIFPVSSAPLKNGVVVTDDSGRILDLLLREQVSEPSVIKTVPGIICPGFINAHCHLELSWMKGHVPEKKGIDDFIRVLEDIRRDTDQEKIQQAITNAGEEMIRNGIVAAGDISNGSDSFFQKKKKNILYHTFIEALGFHPERAAYAFEKAKRLYRDYLAEVDDDPLNLSITPHAPYSASAELLEMISSFAGEKKCILSIHNQESEEENEFFMHKKGKFTGRLRALGIKTDFWEPPGKTSLLSTLPQLPRNVNVQLVHNVVTSRDEIKWAEKMFSREEGKLYWCTCPNANLYIEGRLPDYRNFLELDVKMTVGTDSLASNHSLSVLDEMKTIAAHAPFIPFSALLQWSTLNGAEYLGIAGSHGSIEKGKQPGLVNIRNFEGDFLLKKSSSAAKLI